MDCCQGTSSPGRAPAGTLSMDRGDCTRVVEMRVTARHESSRILENQRFLLGNLQPIIIGFWPVQAGLDDAFNIGQAIDAYKLVTYPFGPTEMAKVPAHMFAQFDEVIFAFEGCMYTRMFKSHQQALFAAGRWI